MQKIHCCFLQTPVPLISISWAGKSYRAWADPGASGLICRCLSSSLHFSVLENALWRVRMGGMADPQLQAVFAQTGAAKALLWGEVTQFVRNYPKAMHEKKLFAEFLNPGFLTKLLVAGGFSCRMWRKQRFPSKKTPQTKQNLNKQKLKLDTEGGKNGTNLQEANAEFVPLHQFSADELSSSQYYFAASHKIMPPL